MQVTDQDLLDDLLEQMSDLLEGAEMTIAISALANVLVDCMVDIGKSISPDQAINTLASVSEQMQLELEEALDINISEQSH